MSIEQLIYTLVAVIAVTGAVGMILFMHAVYKETVFIMQSNRTKETG
jgi:uncharacterized membrane protein